MQTTNDIILYALIIASICAIVVIVLLMLNQRKRVLLWLTYAVSEAEKQLGKKTGQYKLRIVYDQFIKVFPKLSVVITPALFSRWVDIALKTMNEWLDKGTKIGDYILNKESEEKQKTEKPPQEPQTETETEEKPTNEEGD